MDPAIKTSSLKRRRQDPRLPVLYLDYDGVLHPDEVYRVGDRIVLRMDGIALFEWCSILEMLVAPYPDVQIMLSTTWVRVVGFDGALARLPERIQRRVVGATWQMHAPRRWAHMTRFEQIHHTVKQHRHQRWLAIDDDGAGWPDEYRENLVLTDSLLGLGAISAQQELSDKLKALSQ